MKSTIIINKIFKIIGIIFIATLVVLVYFYNIFLGKDETIIFSKNNIIVVVFLIAIFITIYLFMNQINNINIKAKTKVIFFVIIMIFYFIAQLIWINIRREYPLYDQFEVYNDAKIIAEGKIDNLVKNDYLQTYPHQITLVLFYTFIFKIFGTTDVIILQYINAIANTFSIIGLYFITKMISDKKNTINSIVLLVLSLAFIPLSLLSTFVYGDLLGLVFAIYASYFIIKYAKTKKLIYLFLSAIFMSLSYFCRMNMLIVLIAIVIYLFLNLFKWFSMDKNNNEYIIKDTYNKKKSINLNFKLILKLLLIILFILTSIIPTNLFKRHIINKLQLDESCKFPIVGHLNHGISSEGFRGPGWYVDKYFDEWKENGHNNEVLNQRFIKIMMEYLKNPVKAFNFFIKKVASMWNESTFESIWHNTIYMDINDNNITEDELLRFNELTDFLINNYKFFIIFGKLILIIIYTSVLLFLLRNKDITNEQVLILLIFLGGFAFHLLWEGKSRYVLPYVVFLIPIASIGIKENILWMKNKFIKSSKLLNKKGALHKSKKYIM